MIYQRDHAQRGPFVFYKIGFHKLLWHSSVSGLLRGTLRIIPYQSLK